MVISLIVAVTRNGVIGREGKIPWHLPQDLRRFRDLTHGHPIIMGRKTFQGIGHPLPGRKNIIITRQKEFHADGCLLAGSLDEALLLASGADEVFVCGGGEIYRQALPLARRIYVTELDLEVTGDTSFPPLPAGDFREVLRETLSESPRAVFKLLERIIPPRNDN
jgi:dihydrofolate reductase